jgi:hypothetical protein
VGTGFARKLTYIHPWAGSLFWVYSQAWTRTYTPPFFQWYNLLEPTTYVLPHLLRTPKANGRLLLVTESETNNNYKPAHRC